MGANNQGTPVASGQRKQRPRVIIRWVLVLAAVELVARGADTAFQFWPPVYHALSHTPPMTDAQEADEQRDVLDGVCAGRTPWRGDQPILIRKPGVGTSLQQELDPDRVVREGGKAVFVVGESVAYGMVDFSASFAHLLDETLGDRGYHVYNAGHAGANSTQVLGEACNILNKVRADTMIVFMGNNTWIAWKPPGQDSVPHWVAYLLLKLGTSRAVGALEAFAIGSAMHLRHAGVGGSADRFRDQVEMTGSAYALKHPAEKDLQYEPPDWLVAKKSYLDRFEMNLAGIVEQAQKRGTRVILLTLPLSYRLAPAYFHPQFEAYDPVSGEAVRAALRQAADLMQQHEPARASAAIDSALKLDPLPPVLHYMRGQCLEELGSLADAESAYTQCRENMIGEAGSILSTNERVRAVAARFNATLVDVQRLFEDYEHARGRYFNAELIDDWCHPNAEGNKLIAEALSPLFP